MTMRFSEISALAGLVSALSCAPAFCDTYTLLPGTVAPSLNSGFPIGGTTLDSVISPFNNGVLAGTLTSQVLSGDTSNPYAGGLTFTYQLSISPSSRDSATQLSLSSFAGFQTDLSYTTNGSGFIPAPSQFGRNSSGSVISCFWLTSPVTPGSESALIVVQTDSANYQDSLAGIIDGLTVNVASLAPIAVPEPGMMGLLLVGLGCVFAAKSRAGR